MGPQETYRRVLRISAVVMGAVLMFQSGFIDERSTALFNTTTDYLAANVGMSVSVAPTEYNAITAELTRQKLLLDQREATIEDREIFLNLETQPADENSNNRTTYLLAAVLFVQLILIVLNYALDYLRSRGQARPSVESALSSG